jgi:hypothetical protein
VCLDIVFNSPQNCVHVSALVKGEMQVARNIISMDMLWETERTVLDFRRVTSTGRDY